MIINTDHRRRALRAAVKIHEHLTGPARRGQLPDLPHAAWQELCRTSDRLRLVERRGWHAASKSLLLDLNYAALCLLRQIEPLRQNVSPTSTPNLVASAGEIFADLIALEDEFEQVDLDLQERSAAVLTAPIVLEDVYLGPFRVVLHWERVGCAPAYRVVALEPHCAEGQDDVTHPHVRDQQLCEGDGASSIKAALSTGRLYDFFLLVRQILGTYNPDSAHVSLGNWDGGLLCAGCGCSVSEDDYSSCERCDEPFCSDCTWSCDACSTCVCSGCSADCAQCHNRFCLSCLAGPAGTSRLFCTTCLEAQDKDPPDDTKDANSAPAPADPQAREPPEPTPAANTVCLGQTPLPSRPGNNRSRRVRRQQPARPATRRRRASRTPTVLTGDGEV